MNNNLANIKKSKFYLDKGYCIAIPTETVYGLAANAYQDRAVEKILPDDIDLKSLNELTELASKIIENLENQKNLENSINEYKKLLKLHDLIQKKFNKNTKEISENTKSKIKDILNKKNEKKIK